MILELLLKLPPLPSRSHFFPRPSTGVGYIQTRLLWRRPVSRSMRGPLNTDAVAFGRRSCVAFLCVPVEHAVAYVLPFLAPTPPPPSSASASASRSGVARLSHCVWKEDACKLAGCNDLLGGLAVGQFSLPGVGGVQRG